MSDKDIVARAREFLNGPNYTVGDHLALLRALADEVGHLRELVIHMHVHSGYRNNGYMQMTTPQKALYDAIWERSVAELDAEESQQ